MVITVGVSHSVSIAFGSNERKVAEYEVILVTGKYMIIVTIGPIWILASLFCFHGLLTVIK